MEKLSVKADTAKNRLYVTFNGFFSDEEIRELGVKVIEEAKKLKPGFDMIGEMTNFKPTSQAAVNEMTQSLEKIKKMGLRRTIRVQSASALSQMQLDRMTKEAGAKEEFATSVAEAEKMLGDI